MDTEVIGLDGDDEIIYSQSFLVYENKLTINFLEKKFVFNFETTEPVENQKDINITWEESDCLIVLSKKFRNSLGAGTTNKLKMLKVGNSKNICISMFGQQFGENSLNVTINFYIK